MIALIALAGVGIGVCLGFWVLWKVQLPPHRRAYTVSHHAGILSGTVPADRKGKVRWYQSLQKPLPR